MLRNNKLIDEIVKTDRLFTFRGVLLKIILLFERPFNCFLLSFVFYFIIGTFNDPSWSASPHAYFNYLADAFLNGQLHLRTIPASTLDLVFKNNRYYLYWPPLPAVLLMPLIAIFGVDFSDRLFVIGISAINVLLIAQMLRKSVEKNLFQLTPIQRALLVIFFAFGTVHSTLVVFGGVWSASQLIGFLCVGLAYLSTLHFSGKPSFFYTGFFIACGLATRNNLIFTGVWPVIYLLVTNRELTRRNMLAHITIGLVPIIVTIALLAFYNWARFGSILDVGLNYHLMNSIFAKSFSKYGAFNIHYIPINVYYQYLVYPFPPREDFLMGGSLFLLSPVFFYSFSGIKLGKPRWMVIGLVITILFVDVPILMLMGTGYLQFGPRYTLDFTIALLFLTAYGLKNASNRILFILTLISIIHYVNGIIILILLP